MALFSLLPDAIAAIRDLTLELRRIGDMADRLGIHFRLPLHPSQVPDEVRRAAESSSAVVGRPESDVEIALRQVAEESTDPALRAIIEKELHEIQNFGEWLNSANDADTVEDPR